MHAVFAPQPPGRASEETPDIIELPRRGCFPWLSASLMLDFAERCELELGEAASIFNQFGESDSHVSAVAVHYG